MPPLTFRPIIKQIRWGGRRLGEQLGKTIGLGDDYAESWEVVDHGEDQSVVEGGPLDGRTLAELVRDHGADLFGTGNERDQFPLLIKFLDASDRLSVQVHPDDELARQHDPKENGKTEAWVILDAEPGSKLWCGLRPGVNREQVQESLDDGTMAELLHEIPVKAGDCVFIPAGTVHAIGEGILLAEVQQSSDLTFRYFDWNRVGADGNPRQLHVEESLVATDWGRGPVEPVQPQAITTDSPNHEAEHLVKSDYFELVRHSLTGPVDQVDDGRLHVLMVLSGEGGLDHEDGTMPLRTGQTVVLPAKRGAVSYRTAGSQPLVLLDATIDKSDLEHRAI